MDLSAPGRELPGDPSVAVSPEGRAIVAWWRRDASLAPRRDVVQIRRRAAFTAPFVGPVTLSRSTSNFAARVDAAVASGGAALVGWTEGGGRAVALRIVPRTGAPPAATVIDEGAVAGIDPLEVGIAPGGSAVAAWTRVSGGTTVVRLAVRSPLTGAWSAAGDLSAPGGRHPAVAVAPDGSALVAWDRGGLIEISRIGADGVVAGPPVALSPASDARLPAVAVNAAGDAIVAWYQDGSLQVAERSAGGAFAAPRPVSSPGGLPDVPNFGPPAPGLAADGLAVVAWRQRTAGHLRVRAAIRPPGLPWDAPTTLSPVRATRNAGRPSLAMDAAGHGMIAWSQPAGRSGSMILAVPVLTRVTGYGDRERVSTAAGRGTAPAVGLDATGRAVLAWREDPVGGVGRFFRAAVRFSPG